MQRNGTGSSRSLGKAQRLLLVGTELAAATLIGLLGGHSLDSKLGSRPVLTLIGLVLGLAAGFKNLIRLVRDEQARLTREALRERNPDTIKPE